MNSKIRSLVSAAGVLGSPLLFAWMSYMTLSPGNTRAEEFLGGKTKSWWIERSMVMGAAASSECWNDKLGFSFSSTQVVKHLKEKGATNASINWYEVNPTSVQKSSRMLLPALSKKDCSVDKDRYTNTEFGALVIKAIKREEEKRSNTLTSTNETTALSSEVTGPSEYGKASRKCWARDPKTKKMEPSHCTVTMSTVGVFNITHGARDMKFQFKPMMRADTTHIHDGTITWFSTKKGEMVTFHVEWQWGSEGKEIYELVIFLPDQDENFFSFVTTPEMRRKWQIAPTGIEARTGSGELS